MALSKFRCTLFALSSLYGLISSHTFASSPNPFINIPNDLIDSITTLMTGNCRRLPYEGGDESFYLRHATPHDYTEIILNQNAEELADRSFYELDGDQCLENCFLSLCEAVQPLHPNIYLSKGEYIERAYAFFRTSKTQNMPDTLLGFIHSSPGLNSSPQTGITKLSYYMIKGHRQKGYAMPMIGRFIHYLNTLRGKTLLQMTLPPSRQCTKILHMIANGDVPFFEETGISIKWTAFTGISASVSLANSPSFIPLSRFLPLTTVHQIWHRTSPALDFFVPETGDRLSFNTLLVFSTPAQEEPAENAPQKESEEPELFASLKNAFQEYVNNPNERKTSFQDLKKAAIAYPVSQTLLPEPTDKR